MTPDQMRAHAQRCRSEAETAFNPAVQLLLREMAAKWDALAEIGEQRVTWPVAKKRTAPTRPAMKTPRYQRLRSAISPCSASSAEMTTCFSLASGILTAFAVS
jgi:hypothetical protein